MLLYLCLSANRIKCFPTLCWVKGRWVKGPSTALEHQLLAESCESTDSEDRTLLRTKGFSQKQPELGKPYHDFRNPLDAGALCGLWVHQVCCDGGDLAGWSCGLLIVISKSQLKTPKYCSSTLPIPQPWDFTHSSAGVSKAGATDLADVHPPSPQEAELHWTEAAEHRAGAASTVAASLSSFVAFSSFLSPHHRGGDTENNHELQVCY